MDLVEKMQMWKLKSHLLCLFLTCVNKVDASFHDGDAIRTLLVTCPSIIGCFAFYYCFIGHLSNDVSQPAFSAVFFKMNPCFSSRQPHPDFHHLFQMLHGESLQSDTLHFFPFQNRLFPSHRTVRSKKRNENPQ